MAVCRAGGPPQRPLKRLGLQVLLPRECRSTSTSPGAHEEESPLDLLWISSFGRISGKPYDNFVMPVPSFNARSLCETA